MNVMDAIKQRYSCRAYKPDAVEEAKLVQVLESARQAPSARNFQDWRFVIVTNQETRQGLMAAARNQAFVAQAPVVIAACSVSTHLMRCGQQVGPIDVAIALEHIALAAASLGLATCWVGSFQPDKIRQVLAIPSEVMVVELMTLGYPAGDGGRSTSRLPMDKIACREKWTF